MPAVDTYKVEVDIPLNFGNIFLSAQELTAVFHTRGCNDILANLVSGLEEPLLPQDPPAAGPVPFDNNSTHPMQTTGWCQTYLHVMARTAQMFL